MSEITKKKILLIEDEEMFLVALQIQLDRMGYQVIPASGCAEGKKLLENEKCDFVVSDIRMPDGSGVEILKLAKKIKPLLPVVLMTGFADIPEIQEANKLCVDGILAKPFRKDELEQLMKLAFETRGMLSSDEDLDDRYCRVSIDDFVSGKDIKYDIFIRLNSRKYVKIAHKGENISLEQVKQYRSKNILYLYLSKDDFTSYIGMNMVLADGVKKSKTLDKKKKLAFLKHTGEILLEHVQLNGVDGKTFDDAKTIVESTVSLLSDDADLLTLLDVFNSHADFLYAHSLAVSTYGVMIARALGWGSQTSTYKVAIGGLFHDIGMKELPVELIKKARTAYSAEELLIYQEHAMRGAEILNAMPALPVDIVQIACQHHETNHGTGYPMGLLRSKIHTMAKLIAVADQFCYLALKGPNGPGIAPHDAIHRILTNQGELLDSNALLGLMKVFMYPPPKQFLQKMQNQA